MGPSVFLSSADGDVGELLELHQGCQGPYRGSKGKVGFLSRRHSGKGPHLALSGESHGFSRVAAGNLGFLSSYDRGLRNPLVWPQESPVSMRVARALSGFLSSWYRVLSPHLELSLDLRSGLLPTHPGALRGRGGTRFDILGRCQDRFID